MEADGSFTFQRDANDQRVLDDVAAGTGDLIDDFSEFPGWPTLAAGTTPADGDDDGMPDAWESLWGLDPLVAAPPGQDSDLDGYTDIEEFLNGTAPVIVPSLPALGWAGWLGLAVALSGVTFFRMRLRR